MWDCTKIRLLLIFSCQAPIAHSVAMGVVIPGVVSSNPSLANILSDVWQKKIQQASFIFHQLADSLCGNQSVAWKDCSVEY